MKEKHDNNGSYSSVQLVRLYPCPVGIVRCPFCQNKTRAKDITIKTKYAGAIIKFPGRVCDSCNSFFTVSKERLESAMQKASEDCMLKLNYSLCVPYDSNLYTSIREDTSFILQVTMCSQETVRTITIVRMRGDANKAKDIYHYTNVIALKLLTLEYREDVNVVVIDDVVYTIQNKRTGKDKPPIISKESKVIIETKNNGGLYDPSSSSIQLDALVFATGCDHLVPLSVSYNRKEDIYYVDKKVLERFRRTYGLAICGYGQLQGSKWNKLNEESLLYQLGYNVKHNNGLNDKDRQELLLEIVQSGIMTTRMILNHLQYLLLLNEGRDIMSEACIKWDSDFHFLLDYGNNHDNYIVGEL